MLGSIPVIGQLTMYVHSVSPPGVIESRPVPLLRTTATQVSSAGESRVSDCLRRPAPKPSISKLGRKVIGSHGKESITTYYFPD